MYGANRAGGSRIAGAVRQPIGDGGSKVIDLSAIDAGDSATESPTSFAELACSESCSAELGATSVWKTDVLIRRQTADVE
jgi:hypothetical protein